MNDIYVPLEIKLTQWLVVGFVNYFPPITALRILEVRIESTLTAFDVIWSLEIFLGRGTFNAIVSYYVVDH